MGKVKRVPSTIDIQNEKFNKLACFVKLLSSYPFGNLVGATCKQTVKMYPEVKAKKPTKKITSASLLGNHSADAAMKNRGTNANLIKESIATVLSDVGESSMVMGLPRKFPNKCVKKRV